MFPPIMSNNIHMINLELAAGDYEPVKLSDFKTLVCLIFRKIGEKRMM